MRRFVKALSLKRDKSDNNSRSTPDAPPALTNNNIAVANKKGRKPSHSLRIKSFIPISSSPLTSSPSTPQLSLSSDHLHSSSASSSAGSVDINLQTPVDEQGVIPSTIKNKSWSLLVTNKKATAVTTKDSGRPLSKVWPDPPSKSHPDNVSKLPQSRDGKRTGITDGPENDAAYDQPHNVPLNQPLHPALRQNMRVLIENKRLPIPVSYPFTSFSTGPLYPRSCNKSADLPRKRSIRYMMFQKRLLQRMDETPSDPISFQTLVTSCKSIPIDALASLPLHVTAWPSETYQITSFSLGIRRWISRPYFEETHDEYLPSEEGIMARRISGTFFGVAAFDYSEALDILAYPDDYTSDTSAARADVPVVTIVPPSTQLNLETAASLQPPPSSGPMSPSILVRNHVSAVPSPLRKDALSSTSGSSKAETAQPPPLVQRGVRFAEDDDTLPLYIVRMKKKREEKARFLRSENQRRELEARRTMKAAEEERRRKESEQMEREKSMQEMKVKEEEQKQQVYLEQVAATRLRREANRAGAPSGTTGGASTSPSTSLHDLGYSSKSRDARRRSNPINDIPLVSRRESSIPGSPPHSSSESSRSPSVTGQTMGASGEKRKSVPPASLRSTHSSDDVSPGTRNRRNSAMAQVHRPSAMRNSSYPMWANGLFAPPIPPVTVMSPYMMPMDPSLAMDTPLLPPAAPFMMQQHSRRSSRQSSPGHSNSSSSRIGTSVNSSSDRVDQSSRFGYSVTPSPSSSRSSGFFTAPPSARHLGPSNIESRRASMPPPQIAKNDHSDTMSTARSQPMSLSGSSRGRVQSVSQQQTQLPSPWTALPTQTGRLPFAMPSTRQEDRVLSRSHGHKQTFIL